MREACRASERVRTVASDSMNPDSVNVSTVPEDEETMVPDGKRTSLTFLLASVSAIIASSWPSKAGAHKATGTPRESTNDTALLEEPD